MSKLHPARIPLRRTPLLILADGLVLLGLLLGTVFCFVSAFHLSIDRDALLAACLLCALAALIVFSLPRTSHCLLALAGLLVLGGLVLWRSWQLFSLGEVWVRCAVVNRFALDFTFLETIHPVAQLPDALWPVLATRFLIAVAAGLALLLGWAVCRVRSFWLTFWLTFPFLVPPLCITVTPDWLPLMVLLACWGALLLASLAARRDPIGSARLTLLGLPALGALLALLTLALPMEGYRQPLWAQRAQVALMDWGSQVANDFSLSDGMLPGPFSGFTAAGSAETVDLSAAGPLRYSGRLMLRVQTQVQGKLYLRGYSAGVYTGTSWEPLSDTTYDSLPELPVEPLNLPAQSAPGADYYPITIEHLGAPGGCLYTPYQMITTPEEIRGARFENDSYIARDRSVDRHTVYFRPDPMTRGTYQGLTGTAAQAEEQYRDFAHQNYLYVPEQARQAIQRWLDQNNWAVEVDGTSWYTGDPAYSLQMLEGLCEMLQNTLADSTRYDPETPALPNGEDFLDYFLNETGRGYCMHYATFSTLFLRMLGYPARYVSGYAVNIPASGQADVPDSAAHAWTEVYIDGYGWYPVDLTPGYEGDALPGVTATPEPTPTPSAQPSVQPTESAAPSQAPEVSTPPSQPPETALEQPGASSALWWLAAPLALVLALAALLIRRRVIRSRRARRLAGPDSNQAAIAAYVWLQALVPWGAECPEAITELAQMARFSQHTLTPEEREQVIDFVRDQAVQVTGRLSLPRRLAFRYLHALD